MLVECHECELIWRVDPRTVKMDTDAYQYDGVYEWFAIFRVECPNCNEVRAVDMLNEEEYEFEIE